MTTSAVSFPSVALGSVARLIVLPIAVLADILSANQPLSLCSFVSIGLTMSSPRHSTSLFLHFFASAGSAMALAIAMEASMRSDVIFMVSGVEIVCWGLALDGIVQLW